MYRSLRNFVTLSYNCILPHGTKKCVYKPLTPRGRITLSISPWSCVVSRTYCLNNRTRDLLQQESVQRHIQCLVEEYRRITQRLHNGSLSELERKTLTKRQIELLPVATAFQNTEQALNDLKEVEAVLESSTSAEDHRMFELLKDEQASITKRAEQLKDKLLRTLVPCDRHDNSDVILEVAAGRTTGGDICQQFTKEVFEMYKSFASYKNWDSDIFNYTPADYGGLHHAAVRISGENVYKLLKFEGGTHRVQRIPEVGLSSRMQRIHTGTMTVIVLPQPSKIDLDIDPRELRVDTFRSRGAGGQSVNTTDSAVRVVHIPTGITVECQQSRSQLQNRDTALRMLRARMYQQVMGKESEERQVTRRQQVGTRSQSERIRTYNFTQDRVTDHRIGHVTRDIKEFLQGGELLDELISELLKQAEMEALLDLVTHRQNG